MKSRLVILITSLLLLASCHSSQELAYISDAQRDSAQAILTTYNTTIHHGDQLYIYVYSQTPEVALPFNQESHLYDLELSQVNNRDSARRVLQMSETTGQHNISQVSGYIVDQEGSIIFPVLGKIVVAGLTQDSLSYKIQQMLIIGGYINDPVVTVTSMNFRVSVVGEVAKPQELHITGERLTVLEALAMCGDITMEGQKENVMVMRDINGVATPIEVNLTRKGLFESQAYYLQTNDIVYVEPNKKKKRKSYRDENWPKYSVFWVSLVAALINIGRANLAKWSNN